MFSYYDYYYYSIDSSFECNMLCISQWRLGFLSFSPTSAEHMKYILDHTKHFLLSKYCMPCRRLLMATLLDSGRSLMFTSTVSSIFLSFLELPGPFRYVSLGLLLFPRKFSCYYHHSSVLQIISRSLNVTEISVL